MSLAKNMELKVIVERRAKEKINMQQPSFEYKKVVLTGYTRQNHLFGTGGFYGTEKSQHSCGS